MISGSEVDTREEGVDCTVRVGVLDVSHNWKEGALHSSSLEIAEAWRV